MSLIASQFYKYDRDKFLLMIFQSFLQQSANNGSINAFKHPGDHITVNTLSDLEEAQKNIKNIITE